MKVTKSKNVNIPSTKEVDVKKVSKNKSKPKFRGTPDMNPSVKAIKKKKRGLKLSQTINKPLLNKSIEINCTATKYTKFIKNFLEPNDVKMVGDYNEIECLDDFLDEAECSMNESKNDVASKPININKCINFLEENSFDNDDDDEEEEDENVIDNDDDKSFDEQEIVIKGGNRTITGNYETWAITNGRVIRLDMSSIIYFHGLMEIEVVYGAIEIFCKRLDKLSPATKAFSPRGSCFLDISNRNENDEIVHRDFVNKLIKAGLERSTADRLRSTLKQGMALIICKKIKNKWVSFLNDYNEHYVFPKEVSIRDYVDNEWNYFKINDDWKLITESFNENSKVMLCGGKGVGKSTILRVLINKLLAEHQKILVLDLDPGQPEFTVPGCVSATIVQTPLIGPNYTHLQKPERCIFVPYIDIGINSIAFLKCVQELLKVSADLKLPTFINLMGMTDGLGINLLSSIIAEVQPTQVVQIYSDHRPKNFKEDLTIDCVKRNRILLTPENSNELSFNYLKIKSVCTDLNNGDLMPRNIRELCILSYFSQMMPNHCNHLTERDVKIYRSDLSEVKIIHDGKECNPMTVNATLVGLCSLANEEHKIYNCHGWGIVRGISKELNIITLLAPLDETEMEAVDHLILGSVVLPPALYLKQDNRIEGLIPYVYKGALSIISKPPKRHIGTKKSD